MSDSAHLALARAHLVAAGYEEVLEGRVPGEGESRVLLISSQRIDAASIVRIVLAADPLAEPLL